MSVRKWIEELPKKGRITFSMQEIENQFLYMSKEAIRSSIYRMIENGRLYSVWRGFYVIIPDEHALKGFVPPIEYIESLMAFTGHNYYIGLLSAAAIYGAGHQQPQVLTIITDSNDIRSIKNKSIFFISKKKISKSFLIEKRAGLSKAMISSPELTALDLICYESRIGGLNRVAEIISELDLDFSGLEYEFWHMHKTPVVQRLGYILENILYRYDCAAEVFSCLKEYKTGFRKTLLDPKNKSNSKDYVVCKKWKIVVNCDLEIEE